MPRFLSRYNYAKSPLLLFARTLSLQVTTVSVSALGTRRRFAALLLIGLLGAAIWLGPLAFAANRRVVPADDNVATEAETTFVRQILVTTSDLAYNPSTHLIYASMPSSAGVSGNSIVSVDPVAGSTNTPVFIGSEPRKLALSDDGQSLWVSLEGAAAIRRFDIPSSTPGLQFQLGQDSFLGTYSVSDFAVAPGNPNLIAVARNYRGLSPPEAGVAVFDNGVQRPTTTPGHLAASDFLAFSASQTKLYGGGFSSGLNTMTINASGVTVSSNTSFAAGSAIRFDNGRVYGSTGQVINPDTGTLFGSFSGVGSGPFTTDSTVGRAYFLTGSQSSTNYSVTLRAFDINTFLSVGTVSISGVNGQVSSLVRWGNNGLAFRTDGGQLFLIQTTLVSSADPIPTPTPTPTATATPTPTPFDTFVRPVPLANNDIAFSPATQLVYASVPSSVGVTGNSIQPINPGTGVTSPSVFIGSEPTKLALSDDGQVLYAALDGAGSVRKFNLVSQTADTQFSLGSGSFVGPLFANDIAILPGNPNSVAVSRTNKVSSPSSDGVAIYDNGVVRTKVSNRSTNTVAVSSAGDRVYSSAQGVIDRFSLDSSGVTYLSTVSMINGGNPRLDGGLLYGTSGGVLDPETGVMKGTFNVQNTGGNTPVMTTDIANAKAFFLTSSGTNATIRAFDLNTFVPLGSISFTIPASNSFNGGPSRLVRWGSNGLAFRIESYVIFVQSALVSSSGVVPPATPTPTPTPSPTATPYVPTFVRQVNLPVNDLVSVSSTQTLYASVPSSAGANGNSITPINPQTGVPGTSVFIGSEPNKLALSDDSNTLHVSLDGASAIRRFDIPTQTPGPQFSWGTNNQHPADMAVVPGSPQALATTGGAVTIYDNGVPRPNSSNGNAYAITSIAFSSASTLYGYDSVSSGFELAKFAVDANGVTGTTIANNLIYGFTPGIKFSNGRLYSASGRVVDPEAKIIKGTFQTNFPFSSTFTIDSALNRVFFISSNGANAILTAFDSNTFVPIGSVTIAGVTANPVRLVRWGTNGLAFNTANSFSDPSASKLYLLQSALVSNAQPIPTGVQVSADKFNTFESSSNITISVTRTGDVSGSTSIDYATSDGTATSGSDYTSVSGTISFSPGQLTRTFNVPILDDNVYEGAAETFNITLSNPTGGAILSSPATAVVTISDNDFPPTVQAAGTFRSNEGDAGPKTFTIPINLSNASFQQVSVNYATEDGSATAGSDYVAKSGTLTFSPGTTSNSIAITVNGDTQVEADETFRINLTNPVNASSFLPVSQITVTIVNDESSMQLSAASYTVGEGNSTLNIPVSRTGDLSSAASVQYATGDLAGANNCASLSGNASSRCDYLSTLGTLNFAAGQASKTISIPIIDDSYAEGNEILTFTLSNPSVGILGSTSSATITITDNDNSNGANPIDQANFFVRLHYVDFLNREPDASGLAYWSNQITECQQPGATCDAAVRRINVSAAFFLSIEFQETGYLVERLYKTAYGEATGTSNLGPTHQLAVPIIRLNEFLPDTQEIGRGVVVGQPGWEQVLDNNKVAFILQFVQRSRFTTAFPTSLGPAQFVDMLFARAGVTPSASERTSIINEFGGAGTSADNAARGRALRRVAENTTLKEQEKNKAFVLMQFFGYLRRNPNDPQDTDYTGYDFWLSKLNEFGGDFIRAEMVKAFLDSSEYRARFGLN